MLHDLSIILITECSSLLLWKACKSLVLVCNDSTPRSVYICFLGSVFISVRVRSNLKNFLSLLNFCFSDHGIGSFRYQIPLTKPEQVCLRLPQHYTFYCLASSCDPKRLILCKLMYWNRALLYSALEYYTAFPLCLLLL